MQILHGMSLNVRALERLKSAVRQEAKAFNMKDWLIVDRSMEAEKLKELLFKVSDDPHALTTCNTTACLAGWTILLEGTVPQKEVFVKGIVFHEDFDYKSYGHVTTASKILGISQDIGNLLFYDSAWPVSYWNRYRLHRSNREFEDAAEVVCELLDNLIASRGRSLEKG